MIRPLLRRFFKWFPPDVFSFVGGAIFAVVIDLAREYARTKLPSSNDILKIAGLFFLAMIGFVWLGNLLRTAQEVSQGKTLSAEEKLANIGDRLKLLVPILLLSLIFTALGFYLVFC